MFTRQTTRPPRRTRRALTAMAGVWAVVAAALLGLPPAQPQPAAAAPAGPTDATKVPHYFGPWPNWANSPLTVSRAKVSITGSATTAQVGNPLTARAYATDYATPKGRLGPVFVVLTSTPLPTGTLKGFRSWNQTDPGGSPTGSEGGLFHGYVLRPTGTADQYTVVADSGPRTVPASAAPGGEVAAYDMPDTPVQAGDLIAFYGEGVPVDTGVAHPADTLVYPAGADSSTSPPTGVAPVKDATVTVGAPGWERYAVQDRTYSFGAQVALAAGGSGAEATATVDPRTGGIASIEVTTPGHGYVEGATTVTVEGGTTAATATAAVQQTRSVVDYRVGAGGSGYGGFAVAVTGGGGSGAAATASGGVAAVNVTDSGAGYTMPTVDFDLPAQPDGTVAKGHVDPADLTPSGGVAKVTVDDPGSGYTAAPGVTVRNGTLADPIPGATPAAAVSGLKLLALTVDTPGTGYASTPDVTVTDPTGNGGSGAAASAVTNLGAISSVTVTSPGAGYLTPGIKKFQDRLPTTCNPGANGAGCPDVQQLADPSTDPAAKFIPEAVPETVTTSGKQADQYVIGLVQYRTRFSSDLPPTLVRGYVQLSTDAVPGRKVPLYNELMDGTRQQLPYTGVAAPQWMGPLIAATKDRPVRIVFRNLLPTGAAGDLFLPVDSTGMGAGMGPMTMPAPGNSSTVTDEVRNPACTDAKPGCYTDNRATLHLHGGITPWISDGTPHQWITPAGEHTDWPQGVGVQNVPDMVDPGGATLCAAVDDGCSTFYYSNQQSARLMFYHDHSYGITRLNVYAGEAAGYTITDDTEKALISSGTIPDAASTLPLLVQDRTFVPDDSQLKDQLDAGGDRVSYGQDPTWDAKRWGGKGSFWYHHVYMPAQNPGDPSGMSSYGRWMYGPWFWPPAGDTTYGPIPNPYHDPHCKLDDPTTWQYQAAPYCEPEQIPGTPNISMGMEQFNDTPLVNGVAYPKTTVQPKTYRLKMLNAANDRFFNFQWYTADPKQGDGTTEVALKPDELKAAQTDPNVSPTPVDANNGAAGPSWIQIANEGGFLPAPAVIDGQQPTTWITDPTRFDVGNVDKHSLTLAPAERADVLVDFSKFAGKTLILYNDAPAAYPARIASYDYYTGAPDLAPAGAPKIMPGYGPNTRTVMQVTVADTTPAPAFNLSKLQAAFRHHADGSGAFESGQNPVIVGQAAYNSAYGTSFAAGSNCNTANTAVKTCDGLVRVNDTTAFNFNTLKAPNAKSTLTLQPKAIHDEMNATSFDAYGRMQATLGVEAQPPTPGAQNVTLYPYINPQTELIDGTALPRADAKVTPIGSTADGTQIWRFTHNGVDTHPMHFHLYDVQVLNRVTWDNIILRPDANELGWKDTVRMSPLEDTIVALRPVVPTTPFEVPNSVRLLDPAMPAGDTSMFNNVDPQGNGTAPITNQLVNFGWEYVIHCHILSHEEMDMMRPESLVLPPAKADGLTASVIGQGGNARVQLRWRDNSINETSFTVQRSTDGTTWTDVGTIAAPLDQPNIHQDRTFVDMTSSTTTPYTYRVVALNTAGYGGQFPSMTAKSVSDPLQVPAAVSPNGRIPA
ncbi:multicopper oxidase domain-containing protein [Kitasatospora sp. CB02891]|uniref:multicopper oxidase domain-containing protein n=1 Tax=Kitasatospora sp. CB02891 TaxID=2020329 RepID=UPI0018E20A84|nr:multicopper oxidase domain-containing protein [Kitasatospora sp. CB02891]